MIKQNQRIDQYIIDDEILIIENSGEMPEVALHGSLYYLTTDPGGPGLVLTPEEMTLLKKAVVACYKKIIYRDLTLENRSKGLYRGLARCAVNWDRMSRFCQQENIDLSQVVGEVCTALRQFLEGEADDVCHGKPTSINCSIDTLILFMEKIGLDPNLVVSAKKDILNKKHKRGRCAFSLKRERPMLLIHVFSGSLKNETDDILNIEGPIVSLSFCMPTTTITPKER